MGKVSVIELTLVKTFREIKRRVDGDNIKISETSNPSCKAGKSVFTEELPVYSKLRRLLFPFTMLPSKPRHIAIHLEGAGTCLELKDKEIETHIKDIWSDKEKAEIVDKIMAKSKASQQIISAGRFYLIVGLLIASIFINVLLIRGGLR